MANDLIPNGQNGFPDLRKPLEKAGEALGGKISDIIDKIVDLF